MSFGRPEWFWLLAPLGLLVAWFSLGQQKRLRSWRALAQRGRPPRLRTASVLIAAVLIVTALSRPRFGPGLGPPLPPGQDVVLLMDVSRSMAAEDAVPNRLATAVAAARTLVDAVGSDPANRLGVAAFAGRGVLRYPLTENLGAVVDVLGQLRPGSVQPGGTDLAAGLDAALDAFESQEHADGRVIVVFSDGEDHADHWRSRLPRLVRMGVTVHAVAIGDDAAGHPVPAGADSQPLMYEGQPVRSRRIDSDLKAVSSETDGAFVGLGLAATDLGALYLERIAPLARLRREAANLPERPEQFPLFLALALGFVVSSSWPAGRLHRWRSLWSRAAMLLAGPLIVASLAGAVAGVPDAKDAASWASRGQAAYEAGDWAEALASFESALRLAGNQPVLRYNAAATLFQLGRYAEARSFYQEARDAADPALQTRIDFALGNCALALREIATAVEHYDRCLSSTARGPRLDEIRRDAALNRRFALEQAEALGASDESDRESNLGNPETKPPQARKPGRDGRAEEGEDADSGPGQEGGQPGGEQAKRGRQGRRRTGGGGGASRNPGEAGRTPDDRLDSALDEIRDAQGRRLPDEEPADRTSASGKDW